MTPTQDDVEDRGISASSQPARPWHVRLPGFIAGEEVGLGDAVAAAARYIGIRPCGGCQHRAVTLNRWMTMGAHRPG